MEVEQVLRDFGLILGAGLLLAYAVSSTARAGIWDESQGVAILAVVALVYFSSATLGGSAYLSAFVMGLIVGNMGEFKLLQHEESERMLEDFVAQVAEIAASLVALAVCATLLLQPTTAGYVARRLDLLEEPHSPG